MVRLSIVSCFFFFNDTATTEIYTLSLHDALPIYFHLGDREERGEQRIGHLVLDDLGCLARVVGVDDHLSIREIRDRIHRHGAEQEYAGHEYEDRAERHELAAPDGPGDEFLDHGRRAPSLAGIRIPPLFRPIPIWSMSP